MPSWMSGMILESAGQWLKSLGWDIVHALGWGGILAVLAGFALMIALSTKALKCLTSWWGATAAALLLVVGLYFMGVGGSSVPSAKPPADRLANALPALPHLSLPDIFGWEDDKAEEESPVSKQEKARKASLAVVDALPFAFVEPEVMPPLMPPVITSHPLPFAHAPSPAHSVPHAAAGTAHPATHPPVVSAPAAATHAQPSVALHPGGMQGASAQPSPKAAAPSATVHSAPSSKPASPGTSHPPVVQWSHPNRHGYGGGQMAGSGFNAGFAQGGGHMPVPQAHYGQGGSLHGGLTHKQIIHQQNIMAGHMMDMMMGNMLSQMGAHPGMHPMAPHAGMMPGGMGHMGGGHHAGMHHPGH